MTTMEAQVLSIIIHEELCYGLENISSAPGNIYATNFPSNPGHWIENERREEWLVQRFTYGAWSLIEINPHSVFEAGRFANVYNRLI
jgi:hypothetical protein